MTYTTIQGDTWDGMAYALYGAEKYMHYLIMANLDYADVLIFSQGVELTVPDLPDEPSEDVPFWREDE